MFQHAQVVHAMLRDARQDIQARLPVGYSVMLTLNVPKKKREALEIDTFTGDSGVSGVFHPFEVGMVALKHKIFSAEKVFTVLDSPKHTKCFLVIDRPTSCRA